VHDDIAARDAQIIADTPAYVAINRRIRSPLLLRLLGRLPPEHAASFVSGRLPRTLNINGSRRMSEMAPISGQLQT